MPTNKAPRIGYIRTTLGPARDREWLNRFLLYFVRQPSNEQIKDGKPRHKFLFTAFNIQDSLIFDVFIESFLGSPGALVFYQPLLKEDIELRISKSSAKTGEGQRTLQRCKANGIPSTICGEDEEECDKLMLEESDYLIDGSLESGHLTWFWDNARPGIPQDTMLTNPNYDTKQLDFSGLANRTKFCVWSRNSGCFHGNPQWRCWGCGGKCKRGRCRVNPQADKPVDPSARLPPSGSEQWRELTAWDVCQIYRRQHKDGAHPERDDWKSVDTFSGV